MADHLMCITEVTMKKTTGKAKHIENQKCKRCWTKTEPKKSKKRSKVMKAMKTMKAVKAMKVMKAKNLMITMKAVRRWGPRFL
jgi:hypothetical protein